MRKSLLNSLQVMEILKKFRGNELLRYLGSAHYRSMLEFSFEALEESSVNFRRIEGFLQRAKGLLKSDIQPSISAQFTTAMNNDLAVPQALADISELVRIGNTAITDNDLTTLAKSASEVRGALEILGCDPFDPIFADSSNSKSEILDGLISLALEQRNAARERKDFAASDAIRDSLTALGITIEDTPTGSRWTVN
jgi:cysteinyl-tRNA synthetase